MIKIATVTGCAGFIGYWLTIRLLSDGWLVYGVDKLTYASNTKLLQTLKKYKTFHFIQHDIAELQRLPDCDVIFNLAAESDVDTSNKNSKQFVLSNTLGVQNLLSLVSNSTIIKDEPPLFIQVSTDEVYGAASSLTESFCEQASLNPGNPYAATKASADLLISSWANTYGIRYNIVRPSNNYGLFQHPEKLIPLSIKKLQRDKHIKLHNKGTPIRTWTHVSDTVEGILTVYNKGVRNNIYNISSEFEQSNIVTIKKLIQCFYTKEVDVHNFIDFKHDRPGQDMRYAISSNKLKKLGWQAKHNINKDMKQLVNKYKNGDFVW
jgi:dTDP-glucose 4,6-dehydratase